MAIARPPMRRIRNKSKYISLDKTLYETPKNRKRFSYFLTTISFGCPLGMEVCGRLKDILDGYSVKKTFLAIPYSKYAHENSIAQVLGAASLNPSLAKDRIKTTDILCKICDQMRKCGYMVADISAQNANVAYELGLMQSLGRECVILFSSRARKHKQSDLKGIEDVRYSNGKELKTGLANWIRDNVKEADRRSLNRFVKGL